MLVYTAFENDPLLFANPGKIITCDSYAALESSFGMLESALAKGYWLAGYISYEAGYGLEATLAPCRQKSDFPLLKFGCYKNPVDGGGLFESGPAIPFLTGLNASVSFDEYRKDIAAIHAAIAAGDVYQTTYCLKLKFDLHGSGIALFSRLFKDQPVPYPAYIADGTVEILSLSPELFMKSSVGRLITKPMKRHVAPRRWTAVRHRRTVQPEIRYQEPG